MFIILSLIAYSVYQNEPPVIFAYNKGDEITASLLDAAKSAAQIKIIRPSLSNTSIRISNVKDFKCDAITPNKIYIFRNSTDLQEIVDTLSTKVEQINVNITKLEQICEDISKYADNSFVIVTNHYPEFKKVGYSNPFTPGVWNCFFFIIFTISFIIWSMIHYSNIDVQTRFAKKLY